MPSAVIAATGLFTPDQSITNAELVAAYNAYADRFNQEHAAVIAAGEVEALTHSSVEFIEKASGIKRRFVLDKAGVLDPARMVPNIPERPDDQLSIMAEMAAAAAREAIARTYPNDRARGYSLNDLRGIWKITLPAAPQP